jgi:DNA-binding HxlR family transcriptional regulator
MNSRHRRLSELVGSGVGFSWLIASLAMCASACAGSDAGYAALAIVLAVVLASLVARVKAARADAQRCVVLADLLRFGPCDGGDLLSWLPGTTPEELDALMLDLERQALVTRQPSAIDPVWRDLWRLTEGGRRVAARLVGGAR